MPDNEQRRAAAVEAGRRRAEEVLAGRRRASATRAAALAAHPAPVKFQVRLEGGGAAAAAAVSRQTAGFLVALGDSWFDYPFHDVLKRLDDEHGYNVESAAHRGDPLEQMAYLGGQIDQFARCLEKVTSQGGVPKAVLLSAGGDDIAGQEFGMLLNSAASPISGWNTDIIDGLLNDRLSTAYTAILTQINLVSQDHAHRTFPIIVHGYDYPVPDGRGFLGGWPFPGPWLQPGFREKGFDDLATNIGLMRIVIDRFNVMLAGFAASVGGGQVHYLDLRGTLSTDLAHHKYQDLWANELHPTGDGFSLVANRFAAVVSTL